MNLDASQQWWARAERVIPLGTQTLSKSPTQWVQGVSPIYLARGRGAHVWDVDGNEYVDYPMALGPILLGHCEPAVDDAIRAQLEDGITFSLMHPLEVEVAERIVALCPGVEAVRFGKSGSDALRAALRAARALTGRDHVLVAGYHGWHDWYIGSTTRRAGVPDAVRELTGTVRFNHLEDLDTALAARGGQVAAVIVEPVGLETPAPGYLAGLVEWCRANGVVSIFDEVITGFRIAPGGARELYGVRPDLSCYGKALGNGMPISAVAGTWDAMRPFEEVFFSGTHGGELLSLAAARSVLDVVADGTVLKAIADRGQRLGDGLRAAVEANGLADVIAVGGHPSRNVVAATGADPRLVRTWVQQCMVERGILFNGSMFVSARHSDEDIDRAIDAFGFACRALGDGSDIRSQLRGPLLQDVFRKP